ncbi:MAG: response regulator transcription factor [Thermoactinospora sp.]|nr:response regulator transcription factor [Thermoactinospora sp.]
MRRAVVLVVDDNPQMAMIVAMALETAAFDVLVAHDGATALNLLNTTRVDLVVLDITMPAMDGLTVLGIIRTRWTHLPVMFLTGRDSPDDVVAGLERGADDYVVLPFHPRELTLRAKALVRRAGRDDRVIRNGKLTIDLAGREAYLNGRRLELSDLDFVVLSILGRNRGTPVKWSDLWERAWQTVDLHGAYDVVKSQIYRLRMKLAAVDPGTVYIRTIRGVGYLMPVLGEGGGGEGDDGLT